jgi:site-specific DNA-methyltransferase (adenine-specific)
LGDCIEVLKTLEDNSVDSIITDPPYHLTSIVKRFGKEGSAPAQYGTDGAFARASKGFMGKEWDGGDIAFRTDVWKECLRVLKPGGHLLSFGGSRTYHRMAVAIEDAGFEVRDQIMWVYGSGFPKSHNIGKKLEDWEGWGTALKPAHEPICMARKPLSEKSIAENVLKHGTGGINIDDCRIGSEVKTTPVHSEDVKDDTTMFGLHKTIQHERVETTEGRFPANIIFDEEAGKILDEQSGISKSTGSVRKKDTETDPSNMDFKHKECENSNPYAGQSGGASRFFYCPKVSKKERNAGLDDMEYKARPGQTDKGLYSSSPYCIDCGKTVNGTNDHTNCEEGLEYKQSITTTKNHHPTVKPIALMEYLIKLVTPKGGVVLEPFMGSGSTGIAAKNLGMSFIGIEKEEEYFEIAKQRINKN